MQKLKYMLAAGSALLVLGGCANNQEAEGQEPTEETDFGESNRTEASVNVEMYDSNAESVGFVIVQEEDEGVSLHLNLDGLPAGEYGMHIHENGSATPPSFEDAGDHFNPTDVEHGIESETGPHLGDLPNLVIPENGSVRYTVEASGVSLDPSAENSLASGSGTSLIIHDEADDYESQPTGDAGDRMAGGSILPLE